MVAVQENDNNNNNNNQYDNIMPGAPKGALCEWLAMAWPDNFDEGIQEDDEWWNSFTMTHGALSETSHSDVPDHATFGQATGTMYDIKTFLESNISDEPGNIIYTSTLGCIPNFIFKMLPPKMEREWKDIQCNLKFDYVPPCDCEVTADQWNQFFAPYGLEFSQPG